MSRPSRCAPPGRSRPADVTGAPGARALTRARRLLVLASVLVAVLAGGATALELVPVLAGLSNPLYVTHARDGSGRLFVVEQGGRIKVLQPGAAAPTVFLDITDRVLAGGERGLLGLAFHPQYPANGRFFVNYTRTPDGATVIAEYRRSADPNLAARAETVLLTIAQPFANHNGGMIEFGPDGFLYIASGDGGSANDPQNRAQNVNDLLGKILRIDVDRTSGALPYAIPADNPFAGPTPGADEIYALGLRNPFRFSFDRVTGQLLVGDVGQASFEEIDIVTPGGNYGWRIFEAFSCTGAGMSAGLCASPGLIPPLAAYDHSAGRCSITGGYVYRGPRGTLPAGTYVFGDFCTGEIFRLNGSTPTVLTPTALSISSFGEDGEGELYVVGLGGTVHRLAASAGPALVAAVLPSSRSVTVGTPATAFATIVNASDVTATGCAPSLATPLAATFTFQTTNPATNVVTGTPNTPVAIPARSSQSFVITITPTTAVPPTSLALGFQCAQGTAAPLLPGVSALLFSADTTPVPDVVALVAVPADTGGVVELPGAAGTNAFAVATANVGAGGTITVGADTGGLALPVTATVCQTDAQARCLAPPAASVTLTLASGATPAFAVFVTGAGTIPFDPTNHRIFVRFRDAGGAVRGATSAAIRTR
jgi:glucose/arabinose dehydrogenase